LAVRCTRAPNLLRAASPLSLESFSLQLPQAQALTIFVNSAMLGDGALDHTGRTPTVGKWRWSR
jgi:hypothetical protein